jgi:hypothetical protein
MFGNNRAMREEDVMTKSKKQLGQEGGIAGERGPAKGEAYGIAALTRSFQGVDFPAEKQALIDRIKDKPEVHWAKDVTLDLREILESLPDRRISGITELTHLMSEHIHQKSHS